MNTQNQAEICLVNFHLPARRGGVNHFKMETVLRTVLIWLAAFFVGQNLPTDAIILPLILALAVALSLLDFLLVVWTGRGLKHHLKK